MNERDILKFHKEDLDRVSYCIETSNKILSVSFKSLRILHLDDHRLFSLSINKCLSTTYPNAILVNINNGNEALNYVVDALGKDEIIDLIITDITHPGLNGYEFAKIVRQKEIIFNKRIPMLLLSMGVGNPIISTNKDNNLFDSILGKNNSCANILKSINGILR